MQDFIITLITFICLFKQHLLYVPGFCFLEHEVEAIPSFSYTRRKHHYHKDQLCSILLHVCLQVPRYFSKFLVNEF